MVQFRQIWLADVSEAKNLIERKKANLMVISA